MATMISKTGWRNMSRETSTNRWKRWRVAPLWLASTVVAMVVSTVVSTVAHAQDVPYSNYLVGRRALGLGGAFVGLADDPSATFHNPAGLAFLPKTSVSTSLWLIAWQRRNIDGGWRTNTGLVDLDDEAINSPPLVVTAVARLGRRDARGFKRHALGLAVLKPLRVNYRLAARIAQVAGQPTDSLATIDVIHRDNARWYGVSYTYGPTARALSFGVSGFVALRSLVHEEVELHGVGGAPSSPGAYDIARHSLFSAQTRHLVLRFGVMRAVSPRWRVGAMVQVPGIALYGRADNREDTYDVDADGDVVLAQASHRGMNTTRPIPWELRVGATFFPMPRALVTVDLGVHGGVGSDASPASLVDQLAMPNPRFLVMRAHSRPSVRAALGGEVMLSARMPMRGGVLAYRSGMPTVPETSERISAHDMHTVGGSLSIGFILSGGHELSFGAAGIHSWGTGSGLDQTNPDQVAYLARDATETRVLLFVGGGRRAAKQFAKTLVKKSEQWILH